MCIWATHTADIIYAAEYDGSALLVERLKKDVYEAIVCVFLALLDSRWRIEYAI